VQTRARVVERPLEYNSKFRVRRLENEDSEEEPVVPMCGLGGAQDAVTIFRGEGLTVEQWQCGKILSCLVELPLSSEIHQF